MVHFAVDVTILAGDEEDMQNSLNTVNKFTRRQTRKPVIR
jgi:hypothetical protein